MLRYPAGSQGEQPVRVQVPVGFIPSCITVAP
jgi:hypothetical protein